ncbi:MAG: tRNA (adenosine(37)-N6)-dimethylallyltransferase MiaA [Oscillospiraceae bacterium]|nr:tRNA (adenosine(37)-N6)-dimethylallyltransferase MiaA [Oscillospiraceae bacterium]
MEKIICIVGPTASGKTGLSVELAKALGAEIVSCDSMQIYKYMDIGTAKPTEEEKQGIVHHMMDFLDPRESYSVSRYVQEADPIVQDILARGKPVVLVGGTGLYLDSLIAGRQFAPLPQSGKREELTQIAETQGIEVLMEQLRAVDPEAAARIHPSNQKRVIRALEIWLETGKTMTQHDLETKAIPPKYQPIYFGLDYENRQDLYDRIDLRVEVMLQQGLVEEVERLLAMGIPANATGLQAIGYKELIQYLSGQGSLQEAKEAIQLGSRRYAKRQRTWFYRNEKIRWFSLPGQPDFRAVLDRCLGQI